LFFVRLFYQARTYFQSKQ